MTIRKYIRILADSDKGYHAAISEDRSRHGVLTRGGKNRKQRERKE